jgi:hypothetical protein
MTVYFPACTGQPPCFPSAQERRAALGPASLRSAFERALTGVGSKKVKGCKRHPLVSTEGLVLVAKVHGANVADRDDIELLLGPAAGTGLPRLSYPWVDACYTGQDGGAGCRMRRWSRLVAERSGALSLPSWRWSP